MSFPRVIIECFFCVMHYTEYFIILVFLELSGKKCQFRFPHNGLEFLEYLLPRMMPIGALHSKAATYVGLIPNMEGSDSQVARMGSIEVIVNQGCLITEDSYLQLCVLQVFRYKSRLLLCY
jgi:hypothetical protein